MIKQNELREIIKRETLHVTEVHNVKDLAELATLAAEYIHELQINYHSEYNINDLHIVSELGKGMVTIRNYPVENKN